MTGARRLVVIGLFPLLLSTNAVSSQVQHEDTDLRCDVTDFLGRVLKPTQMASSISSDGSRGLSGSSERFAFDVSLVGEAARIELRNKTDGDRAVLAHGKFSKGEQLALDLGPERDPTNAIRLSC